MRRRDFITLLGGAAAWPLAARAQQPAMPVVGFLDARSPDAIVERARAYRQGLKESGYVEGENVTILSRFAENRIDRLPELVADLVQRNVAVIATAGEHVALVAKAATTTIPVLFIASQNPVHLGLVASLARPGGNLTGVNFLSTELVAKRLGLLRELVPGVTRISVLGSPANPAREPTIRDAETAARAMGLKIEALSAGTSQQIDAVFAVLARERPDALMVTSDPFLSSRRVQMVNLATRHAIPTEFSNREYVDIGGLMSYGASVLDAWRQSGVYIGRILKGEKPADLPVVQPTKFELVINLKTAKTLVLDVPATLLARADEVIE